MTDNARIQLGAHVSVLSGTDGGKVPSGNPTLVQGSESRVLIDSALGVEVPEVDLVLLSHFHEDHTCGLGALPSLPVQIHELDVAAVRTREGFHAASGYSDPSYFDYLSELYDHRGIAQATGFGSDARWDLGGVTISAVPLPGHTFGHCGFLIEPDGVFVTADVDLSSFGPYYGDIEASLTDTRASLDVCAGIDAAAYATYHHKGVVRDRAAFLQLLAAYDGVLDRRGESILALLSEPRTLDELVGQGVVYRPGKVPTYALESEQRMVARHLDELVLAGRVLHEDAHYRLA